VLNARAGRTIIQEENRSILRLPLRKKRKKGDKRKKENSMHGKMTTANRKEKRVVKSTSTNTLYYFQNVYEH